MSTPLMRAGIQKSGTCPHGLPLGACPICNGMGGGGGISTRGRQPKAGEMTWEQCYAIGQMMKAQKAAQKQNQNMIAQQAQFALLQRIAERMAAMKTAFLNAVPLPLIKAVDGIKTVLTTPISKLGAMAVNTIQNLISNISKAIQTVKEALINITDKLAAVFGEMKNAIEKKISEKFKDIKKKVFNLFGLSEVVDDEDEEARRIEEQARSLELSKMKESIFNLKKIEEESEKE